MPIPARTAYAFVTMGVVTSPADTPEVFLVDASTSVERALIDAWIAGGTSAGDTPGDSPGAPAVSKVPLKTRHILGAVAGRADNPRVTPVRVVWLPPERTEEGKLHWSDALTMAAPRKPAGAIQKVIMKRDAQRHRIVTGEPARLDDLRAAHKREAADSDPQSFARFVQHRAVVALERSERQVTGDRYKVPRLVAEQIMDSAAFQARIREIAREHGMSDAEALKKARGCLGELVAVQSKIATDVFSLAMKPLHNSAWTVHGDDSSLGRLRELNRRYPLVFLPSHRSYADALVLGGFLARNNFPRNHTLGGANLAFWPLGPLARRSGTVFIRRSFGDDEIYKAAVEEYFSYLLAKRFNLEWYFEGGRSRTGKLRPPRYGLMNYVAAAVRGHQVEDVILVPVSIAYERLHELGAIADEQTGGKKKAEGLAWLAKYAKAQRLLAGNVYIRLGEPLSMRERLAAAGDPTAAAAPSMTGTEPGKDVVAKQRFALQKLAFEVAVAINDATPITANALATLALLGVRDRALTVPEVQAVVAPVLRYIRGRGVPVGNLEVFETLPGVKAVVDDLAVAGVVTAYTEGVEPVYSIERGQHLVAAFYRNSGIHWFVNRSILELSVLHVSATGTRNVAADGWEYAKRLRDLLKFEFFFPDRDTFEGQLRQELALIDPQWEKLGAAALRAKVVESGFLMVHRVLRSFFDAQLVVAERLAARAPDADWDKEAFVAECVAVGQQMLLQARLHGPESVSTELFSTALKLAENHGLLDAGNPGLAARRGEFAAELRGVVELVALAEALDPSNRKAIPGVQ